MLNDPIDESSRAWDSVGRSSDLRLDGAGEGSRVAARAVLVREDAQSAGLSKSNGMGIGGSRPGGGLPLPPNAV